MPSNREFRPPERSLQHLPLEQVLAPLKLLQLQLLLAEKPGMIVV